MKFSWSIPLHGVSHLSIHLSIYGAPLPAPKIRQCTITDYGTFTKAVVFPHLGSPNFFSSADEKTFDGPDHVADAKAWCESFIARLGT